MHSSRFLLALLFCFLSFFASIAEAAPLNDLELGTNYTSSLPNFSTVNDVNTYYVNFTIATSSNVTNVTIVLPSNFSGSGVSSATNESAFGNCIPPITVQFKTNEQTLLRSIIFSCLAVNDTGNVSAGTPFNLSITNIRGSIRARVHNLTVSTYDYGRAVTVDGPNYPNVTLFADYPVNVSAFSNASSVVSGNRFNVSATAQDVYGNTNETTGFNFAENHTGMLVYSSGNGSGSSEFVGWLNGTATVNISAAINGVWNNSLNTTGNATVTVGNIVNITGSANATAVTAGQQLFYDIRGNDAAGNLNISGGFNAHTNHTFILKYVSGNGSARLTFNGTANGTASVNFSSVREPLVWNRTMHNVTVSAGNIANSTVSANSTSLVAGEQVRITAMGYDAFNNENHTGGFNYSSNSSSTLLYVSGNGSITAVFSAYSNGTARVNATAERDQSMTNASLNITVSAGPIVNFSISPSSATVITNTNQSYAVTAMDAYGNVNTSNSTAGITSNAVAPALFYINGVQQVSCPCSVSLANGYGSPVFRDLIAETVTITFSHALNSSATGTAALTSQAISLGSSSSGGTGSAYPPSATPSPAQGPITQPSATPPSSSSPATPTPAVVEEKGQPDAARSSAASEQERRMAEESVRDANELIAAASSSGSASTSEAERLALLAQQALDAGRYSEAQAYALEAKRSLLARGNERLKAAAVVVPSPGAGIDLWLVFLLGSAADLLLFLAGRSRKKRTQNGK